MATSIKYQNYDVHINDNGIVTISKDGVLFRNQKGGSRELASVLHLDIEPDFRRKKINRLIIQEIARLNGTQVPELNEEENELTNEQIVAIVCRKMANIDGSIGEAEKNRAVAVAKANELNVDAFIDAWNAESENPHELIPTLKACPDEETRDLAFFAAGRIATADNILALNEITRLFTMAEVWDWAPTYVALKIAQMIRKNPDLKIERVD